jgi:hypothetical protein
MIVHWRTLVDGARGINLATMQLLLTRRGEAGPYVSTCVQLADSLLRRGLRPVDPLTYLQSTGAAASLPQACALPVDLHDGGGTRLDELLYLAAVTRLLNPRKVFEIGTFKGRTTTVFALNAPEAEIVTLDLPPDYAPDSGAYIESDARLVQLRNPVEFIDRYGGAPRCTQVLCDSQHFDPEPHADSVDLAFIDGAHTYDYVKNDTEKVARMMRPDGLVFWHDYGGKGRFRGITTYLHELADRFPVYRVPGTTMAWAPAAGLRSLAASADRITASI